MKSLCAIALLGFTLLLGGCASLFSDPLQAAYESGEISQEEYEAKCLERDEALARSAPAHWELEQTISMNRTELAQD